MSELNNHQTQSEFLKDLDINQTESVLDIPLTEAKPAKVDAEEEGMKAKNRRERRLLEQNQRLREEAIIASTRLQTIQESQNLREGTTEADYLKRIEKIYGTATPEAQEATELLKEALKGLHESVKQEVKHDVEESRGNEAQEIKREEQTLDSMIEDVEDEFDKDLSADDRKGFFTLLEKLSSKDKDGNIIEYADPITTYEVFESLKKDRSNDRAKELAGRSMTRSGASAESKLEDDSMLRFLKENDIL